MSNYKKTLVQIAGIALAVGMIYLADTVDIKAADNEDTIVQDTMLVSVETDVTEEQDYLDRSWKHLEDVGLVKTENGIALANITTLEGFAGNDSDEEWIKRVGDRAVAVHVNEDKSVTYEMTKDQYFDFLKEQTESIKKIFDSFIDQDSYTIKSVEYSDDYLEFRVELTSTVINNNDRTAAYLFATYGKYLRAIGGEDTDENIVINFFDTTGKLILTINSNDLNVQKIRD